MTKIVGLLIKHSTKIRRMWLELTQVSFARASLNEEEESLMILSPGLGGGAGEVSEHEVQ